MVQWQHGLFGCFDDIKTCIFAYVIPWYVFGRNAERVGENCLTCALAMFVPVLNIYAILKIRATIREKKGIDGSCCGDFLTWWCCPICALVQEANEVQWDQGGQLMARE